MVAVRSKVVLGHRAEESSHHSWDTDYPSECLAVRVDPVRSSVAAQGLAHKNHLLDKVAAQELAQ